MSNNILNRRRRLFSTIDRRLFHLNRSILCQTTTRTAPSAKSNAVNATIVTSIDSTWMNRRVKHNLRTVTLRAPLYPIKRNTSNFPYRRLLRRHRGIIINARTRRHVTLKRLLNRLLLVPLHRATNSGSFLSLLLLFRLDGFRGIISKLLLNILSRTTNISSRRLNRTTFNNSLVPNNLRLYRRRLNIRLIFKATRKRRARFCYRISLCSSSSYIFITDSVT